jgi:branched-chain amino acid transport system permease protein
VETSVQIISSGLTLGALYAVGTVALSLVWGSLNVLNMTQGMLLAIGGYAAYAAVTTLGLPFVLGPVFAILVGALVGGAMYYGVIRFMMGKEGFETNVIIATVGLAMVLENVVLKIFGAYPIQQPFTIEGGFYIGASHIPYQNVVNLVVAVVLMLLVALVLNRTRMGRAIRATAQNREAAQLMGVPSRKVFAQVMAVAGALAAISGIMLSTITTLAPTMGYDPMLKAFIICVIAGLGNVFGALYAAFALGMFEALIQFFFGVRFGFPALLLLVIVALIWRPYGVFGRRKVVRQ